MLYGLDHGTEGFFSLSFFTWLWNMASYQAVWGVNFSMDEIVSFYIYEIVIWGHGYIDVTYRRKKGVGRGLWKQTPM